MSFLTWGYVIVGTMLVTSTLWLGHKIRRGDQVKIPAKWQDWDGKY
jgi:hypothetical protein